MNLKPSVRRAWDFFYPDDTGNEFREIVISHLRHEYSVLEIGAGSGLGDQHNFSLRGEVQRYVGIDLDPRVLEHPDLDEAYVADAEELPFAENSFDVVFHTMVAEHIEHPDLLISECARVLKPGGVFLFETPNLLYYPMIVASVTPHNFHEYYVSKFGSGRKSKDVFPTFYRLNGRRAITRLCSQHKLDANVNMVSRPPGYLRFSIVFFLMGILYERLVERVLPFLRGVIIVEAKKVGVEPGAAPYHYLAALHSGRGV